MLTNYINNFDYSIIFDNPHILIQFSMLTFAIVCVILLFVHAVDYYGYRKRFFNIVVYKKCDNLIRLEAKHMGISKKKVIEYIINNHYRNYDPDILKRVNKHDYYDKRWDYQP